MQGRRNGNRASDTIHRVVDRPMLDEGTRNEFRRRRIADALAEICLERGYQETTVADICARAQVGRLTVYRCFPNREEVFLWLLEESIREAIERIDKATAAANGADRWESGLTAFLLWVAEDTPGANVCIVEAPRATPRAFEIHIEAIDRFAVALGLDAAPGSTVPQPLGRILVGALIAVSRDLIMREQGRLAPLVRDELVGFLRLYLPPGTSRA